MRIKPKRLKRNSLNKLKPRKAQPIKLKGAGVRRMEVTLREIKPSERSFSIMDMFNPTKRKEVYNYFDENYEETEDEKEIFEMMNSRRKRGL